MGIPLTDIQAIGLPMVIKEFHWCLLNFFVKSHFHYQLFFFKKNVLQHKTTANV